MSKVKVKVRRPEQVVEVIIECDYSTIPLMELVRQAREAAEEKEEPPEFQLVAITPVR